MINRSEVENEQGNCNNDDDDNVFTDSSLDNETEEEEGNGIPHGRYTKFHHGSSSSEDEMITPLKIKAQIHMPPPYHSHLEKAQVKEKLAKS